MQIQLLNPLLFEWLDETGCDRRNSLRRKAYGLHGSPPIGVSSVLRKRVFQQCQLMGLKMSSSMKKLWTGKCFHLLYMEQTILPKLQLFSGSNLNQFWLWTVHPYIILKRLSTLFWVSNSSRDNAQRLCRSLMCWMNVDRKPWDRPHWYGTFWWSHLLRRRFVALQSRGNCLC